MKFDKKKKSIERCRTVWRSTSDQILGFRFKDLQTAMDVKRDSSLFKRFSHKQRSLTPTFCRTSHLARSSSGFYWRLHSGGSKKMFERCTEKRKCGGGAWSNVPTIIQITLHWISSSFFAPL